MEEVPHDVVSNTTVAWIASAITLVGGAVLGLIAYLCKLYYNWKKGQVEVSALQGDVTLKQQQGTTQLKITVMDDQIAKWKALADRAQAEKAEEHDRCVREVEEANRRTLAERDNCRKEMIEIVNRYRAREELQTKQMQEREHMFDQIVTSMRAEQDAKLEKVISKHQACVEESAELRGRLLEVEKRGHEQMKELEEIKSLLMARDARKGAK